MNGQKYGFKRVDTIPVFQNTMQLRSPWAGGLNAAQFSKTKLNNDTLEDLFIFDRTGDKLLTYINDGNNFIYTPKYEDYFPKLHNWALLRDFNCDGKKDIFSYVSGGIGIWKNISDNDTLKFEFISSPYVYSLQYGNTINLYVSRSDIPDINDVDGDGDLDVLTFGIIGSRIEYHRNMSVENGYGCDSIQFELKNGCWGHFVETNFGTNTCILYDTCTNNVSNPEKNTDGGPKHSGSTVLSLDLNNDSIKDLLLGDVSYPNLVALTNDSKGVNNNTSMISQDTLFPSSTLSVDLQLYPGAFYEDITNDGIKDLLVSPNIDKEAENFQSVWLYENFGTDNAPLFAHIKTNFLQDEMIEVGQSAAPILFDYNNDGLTDLFVSNFGYYDQNSTDNYTSKIALFKNIGTTFSPQFELLTRDFQNLSSAGMDKALHPTFGDLDNDGDIDVIIGDYTGNIHYFSNSSGSTSTMTLSLTTPQIKDAIGNIIDVGYTATPFLFDIDGDNDLDLIIGEGKGNLNYFENIGSTTSPSFDLVSETFGNVEVSEWFTNIGSSAPILFKNDLNETQLFVGSERGYIFHYNNLDNNLNGTFNEVDTNVANINTGPNSIATVADLNNDGNLDLISGNKRGGLGFYLGDEHFISTIKENSLNEIRLYPNPTSGIINVSHNLKGAQLKIFNLYGQLLLSCSLNSIIDIQNFKPGIYFVVIETSSQRETYKVIRK